MKRIFAAIGWVIGLQLLWGVAQITFAMLVFDKRWVGDNFLAANYRQMTRDVPALTDEIVTAILYAAAITFLIGLVSSLLWVVISGVHRIYGPGQAARLRLLWLVLLIAGALSCGGVTDWLIDATRLVPPDGAMKLAASAAAVFVLSYYVVGTLWPTTVKIRPAVPLARLLSVW
jgi:hypothetical protein